jgi:glutaminyl-tRNA synthetase
MSADETSKGRAVQNTEAGPGGGKAVPAARPEGSSPKGGGEAAEVSLDFIRAIIAEDLVSGKHDGWVVTRFPPEPNGYLHIGHAKAICLNFGIAGENSKSRCHLRFDDTNPIKEEQEYVDAIKRDVRWLGYDWNQHEYHASDYFEQLFEYAMQLIRKGRAFVDSLSADQIREYRGTLTEAGRESPYRNRSVEENADLFTRMRAGEFSDGTHVLRAKIDMAHSNINMRDPTIYRIRHVPHQRTADTWCIYPMYDFAHPLSDAIEGVTHSLCTLEFENNRPLYDWFLQNIDVPARPQQIEFARLNLTHMVMSKRRLIELVRGGHVRGWDDPRMPTISGLRRRGYPPAAIRAFCDRIGVAKANSVVDISMLEHAVREELNRTAPRVMAVLRPLKLVIENYPEGGVEWLEAENNPEDPDAGTRQLPFTRELFIEQADFMEDPPKKYFRLSPGREVRLKHAYYVTCTDVVKNDQGEVVEVRVTYDPQTRGGWSEDGRKVKGTLHWVSAAHALPAEVRLYDHLFEAENPMDVPEGQDWKQGLNPDSLQILRECQVEPGLEEVEHGARLQFLRNGYFCVDPDSTESLPVFNRTVSLRDTWAKIQRKK